MLTPPATTPQTCTKCGTSYDDPASHFYRRSRGSYERQCKTCHRASMARWKARNRPRAPSHRDRYGHEPMPGATGRCLLCQRRRCNRWYHDNSEQARAVAVRWKENNRKRFNFLCSQSRRKAFAENPEAVRHIERTRRAKRASAPGSHTTVDVLAQLERQRGRCYWCNQDMGKKYQVDHVIPLSRGGSNSRENLVMACRGCNSSKKDKMPEEFALRLL